MGPSLPIGALIGGRWRIVGVLGEGGFGQVLAAVDESEVGLGEAAIKVLHPNTTPQERADFLGEAKKIATLRHQNLVGYLDSGQVVLDADGAPSDHGEPRPYVVTERCERSLSDHLAAQPNGVLGVDETLAVLADLAAGLAHLHARGLIHRDIKPGNALAAAGDWKLADFGLMRDLTATGSYHRGELLMGTPLYMAPELFTTMMATPPSDVYALGVLAHVCGTGRPLHTGAGPALFHNVTSMPPSIDPALDPRLDAVVRAASDTDPAARPSAAELVELVAAVRAGWAPPAAPPVPVAPLPHPAAAYQGIGGPTVDRVAPGATRAVSGPGPAPYGSPQPGHQPSHQPSHAPPRNGAANGRRRRGPLVAVAVAIVALLLVGGAMSAMAVLRGDDGPDDLAGSTTTATPSSTVVVDDAGTATSVPADQTGGVEIGENVALGDDVVVGTSPPVVTSSVAEPLSHLVDRPCEGDGTVDQVRVVNGHDRPVDYRLTIHHFDADDVRITESFDTVGALPPGGASLLGMASTEDGAVSCRISEFQVSETPPGKLTSLDQAVITSCERDDFLGWFDIVFTVTNPLERTADVEVGFAVVAADGLRIDDTFTSTVYDIGPGETVRDETSESFWNVDDSGHVVDRCVITSVAYS